MTGPDIIFSLFIVALLLWGAVSLCRKEFGGDEDHNLAWHRAHGQWRVRYHDGQLSQPFTRKVAEEYADMFDGVVIPKEDE